jgi:hypothetical protein
MRTLILCSFLVFILSAARAQTLGCEWAKSAGGTGNTLPTSIATDPSGNSFVTGTFTGPSVTFGGTTLSNAGNTNIFLAKYDHAGNVLWAKSGKGNIKDYAYQVAADHSGNSIITGCYESSSFILGTDTLSASFLYGSQHAFVAKYDPSGNLLWAAHPLHGNATGLALAADAMDNIYVAGLFNCGNIAFGTDTLVDTSNLTFGVVFLAKYNSAGNVLWAISSIGTAADALKSLATDADGNVYATGFVSSQVFTLGGVVLNNTGGRHAVTAKISSDGTVLWARTSSGGNSATGNAIAIDATGNPYVTGSFLGDTLLFGTAAVYNPAYNYAFQNGAMFLVKYDTAGNAVWAREEGFSQAAYEAVGGTGVVTRNGNSVYVIGNFYGDPSLVYGIDTLTVDTANYGRNLFVAAYDTSGNLMRAASPTGSGSCSGTAIAIDDSGALYICGACSRATVDFGVISLSSGDSSNAYIAKIAPPATAAVKNVSNDGGLKVYPVPSSYIVNVNLAGIGYTSLNIYDLSGNAVLQEACNPAANNVTHELDLHALAAGVYILQAIQNGSKINRKIIIE